MDMLGMTDRPLWSMPASPTLPSIANTVIVHRSFGLSVLFNEFVALAVSVVPMFVNLFSRHSR